MLLLNLIRTVRLTCSSTPSVEGVYRHKGVYVIGMIKLVKAFPDCNIVFDHGPRLVFRWWLWDDAGTKFKSDCQSIYDARGLDALLLIEFKSRYEKYSDELKKCGIDTINAYFEWAKAAALRGAFDVETPPAWHDLHRAYRTYRSCNEAMRRQMLLVHPSAKFCTLNPQTQTPGELCFVL